jgi:hypothetical protein
MEDEKEVKEKKPKVILTFAAQQYGLTVEDVLEQYPNLAREDIVVMDK